METPKDICLSCGEALSPSLVRSGSLRCHDCRDFTAPLRRELVEQHPERLRRRLRLRRAA